MYIVNTILVLLAGLIDGTKLHKKVCWFDDYCVDVFIRVQVIKCAMQSHQVDSFYGIAFRKRWTSAPDLMGAQGPPPCSCVLPYIRHARATWLFFCEENLLVDAVGRPDGRYFTGILFDVTKQLHTIVSLKSVRYLNLLNARASHVERISLSPYSWQILRLLYSDSHRSHMSSIVK